MPVSIDELPRKRRRHFFNGKVAWSIDDTTTFPTFIPCACIRGKDGAQKIFKRGSVGSFKTRMVPSHEKWSKAQSLGATHVHAKVVSLRGRVALQNKLIGSVSVPTRDEILAEFDGAVAAGSAFDLLEEQRKGLKRSTDPPPGPHQPPIRPCTRPHEYPDIHVRGRIRPATKSAGTH